MMLRIVTLLCIAAVATSYAQDSGRPVRELTLDVVAFRDLAPVSRSESPGKGILTHSREPRPALSAELLPLERSQYAWGEEFDFKLRIKNVGVVPVTLPWAADGMVPEEVDHENAPVSRAVVLIQIESLDGKRQLGSLDGFSLGGVATTPGSLQRLPPGATAVFRVPARWSSVLAEMGPRVLKEPKGQIRVRGVIALLDTAARATSTNAEVVTLVRPQP